MERVRILLYQYHKNRMLYSENLGRVCNHPLRYARVKFQSSILFISLRCDALQQKVPKGPCYKLLVRYKYHSVISVKQSFQVRRFDIECKL